MNPMILIGLGAVALMAMGGKKKPAPVEEEYEDDGGSDEGDDGPPVQQFVATKIKINVPKKAVMAKRPPLNYRDVALSQASVSQAKACHLQGMNDLNEITMCIAKKVFPNWNWTNRIGWQQEAWAHMMNVARGEMGLPPIIS